MLTNNIRVLQERFPGVWKDLKAHSDSYSSASDFQVEKAKSGLPTLKSTIDGKAAYIHSKYDPVNEAEQFLSQFDAVEDYEHVFFYGLGMGYHVERFAERYPEKSISIYEPLPEVAYRFLSERELSDLSLRKIKSFFIEWHPSLRDTFLNQFIAGIKGKVLLIILTSYDRIFSEQTKEFAKSFSAAIHNQLDNINVNKRFELHWTLNSIRNLPRILETANVVVEKRRFFEGKPVVLVSAGPSLEYEYENLKHIKENGLAYIIAVGSANRSLIRNGIYPDAVTTYDPLTGIEGLDVFGEITERDIKTIPMIFGSTVGHQAVNRFTGPTLHMFINQDTVSHYYLGKDELKSRTAILSDAPSIAIVTLNLLALLGCSTIILAGQNFAYLNDQYYASGIEYGVRPTHISAQEKASSLRTIGVNGEEVLTTPSFNLARMQMEAVLKALSHINCLNTTQGGARINGTTFMSMDAVIRDRLAEKVVDSDWYKKDETVGYNRVVLRQQAIKMSKAYKEWDQLYDQLVLHFRQIAKYIRQKNLATLERQFPKLDSVIKKFMDNDFSGVFLQPMLRNQHQYLTRSIPLIRETIEPISKGEMILDSLGRYVYAAGGLKNALEDDFYKLQSLLMNEPVATVNA
jgi:hypothetical protein